MFPAPRQILAATALALACLPAPSRAEAPALATSLCQTCHGPTGNSPRDSAYPSLAGQKPAYLRQELEAFRSGARDSQVMQPLAAALTDTQIQTLAAWYAAQKLIPSPSPSPADAPRGATIFLRGSRGTAACAACHAEANAGAGGMGRGMMGGGMMMMMSTPPELTPLLSGQNAAYLRAQLQAYSTGARPSEVMGTIAARLSPADRQAVVDFLASQK